MSGKRVKSNSSQSKYVPSLRFIATTYAFKIEGLVCWAYSTNGITWLKKTQSHTLRGIGPLNTAHHSIFLAPKFKSLCEAKNSKITETLCPLLVWQSLPIHLNRMSTENVTSVYFTSQHHVLPIAQVGPWYPEMHMQVSTPQLLLVHTPWSLTQSLTLQSAFAHVGPENPIRQLKILKNYDLLLSELLTRGHSWSVRLYKLVGGGLSLWLNSGLTLRSCDSFIHSLQK